MSLSTLPIGAPNTNAQQVRNNRACEKKRQASPHNKHARAQDYDGQPVDLREHQDASEFLARMQVSAVHYTGHNVVVHRALVTGMAGCSFLLPWVARIAVVCSDLL
jgi:hypothetical protein